MMACDQFVAFSPLKETILLPKDNQGIYLKVVVNYLTYHFEYSFDGERWLTLPSVFDTWKLSDDYVDQGGYFTGAFVGLHCVDLTGGALPADFDYFGYEEID